MKVDASVTVNMAPLAEMPDRVEGDVGQVIKETALDVLATSIGANQQQHPGAPVKEGILRGSASVHFGGNRIATGPAATGATPASGGLETDALSAVVSFNAVYAEYQHERKDLVHPKGGAAKYLEDPVYASADTYRDAVAKAVKKATGAQ